MGDYVKFNNNNVWEIVPNSEFPDREITCYKRELGNRLNAVPYKYKYIINEDFLGLEDTNLNTNWNYDDWKAFFGNNKLKTIASNFSTEQYSLPLIYWVKYVLGFNDDSKMERINSTRYKFRK